MKKIKLGICSWCFPNSDLFGNLEKFAELGLSAVEIDLGADCDNSEFLDKEYCAKIQEKCNEFGVSITSLGVNGLFQNSPFDETKNESRQNLMNRSLEIANNFGIKILQVPAFGTCMMNSKEKIEMTAKFMQKYCDMVAESGITVSTENTLSAEENLDLVKLVDRKNFAIYFDTQNPHQVHGYYVPDLLEKIYDNVVEMHAKDGSVHMSNRLLGKGESSFVETANVIKKLGYDGTIHLENNYLQMAENDEQKAFDLIKYDVKVMNEIFA